MNFPAELKYSRDHEWVKMIDETTALIGISKPVIKAHGSSNDYAMKNAIRQAVEFAKSGIIEDIAENVSYMRLPVKSAGNEQ